MKKILITLGFALVALFGVSAPPAQADYLFDMCPSGTAGVVTNVTSCPFADNVRYAWARQGAPGYGSIAAYSPVTGVTYSMYCTANQMVTFSTGFHRYAVLCTGGSNAGVVFW